MELEWSDWIKTLQAQPGDVPSLLDQKFQLEKLDDPGQARALIQALKHEGEKVFFLEDEEGERFLIYENGDWQIRSISPDYDQTALSIIVRYTVGLSDVLKEQRRRGDIGDYYSLRPLIYGGEFWLDEICANEIDRFRHLGDEQDLSVMLIDWKPGDSLFNLVESLRRGDRIGYFENKIGVLLPFTSPLEARGVSERIEREFFIENAHHWFWNNHFENHFDLKSEIEQKI